MGLQASGIRMRHANMLSSARAVTLSGRFRGVRLSGQLLCRIRTVSFWRGSALQMWTGSHVTAAGAFRRQALSHRGPPANAEDQRPYMLQARFIVGSPEPQAATSGCAWACS
jgi:hypothetical protein